MTTGQPTIVRPLAEADLPAVLELRRTVMADLPEGYLREKSEGELRSYLDGTVGAGFGIGDDALSAVALVRIAGEDRPNPEPAFPLLSETDWKRRTCVLENAMVAPAARGRQYQRRLVDARLAHAAAAGMRWACTGTRLDNRASWTNLLAAGFAIVGIRLSPGFPVIGLLRPIDGPLPAADPASGIRIAAGDTAGHDDACRRGFVGTCLAPDGAVVYVRPAPGVG